MLRRVWFQSSKTLRELYERFLTRNPVDRRVARLRADLDAMLARHTERPTDADHDLEANRTSEPWVVTYFERLDAAEPNDTWRLGAETAREWARLIGAPSPSAQEIASLIEVVHVNRRRSSGWDAMASGVYFWAKKKGHPVPPFEDFFARQPAAPPPRRA